MPYTADDERWREYHVTPRYLAGSNGVGDAGFAPVSHWPHHHLDDGPCQLLVTSPDQRIHIGWFGDDFDLWKITAAEDAVSAPRWSATFNHVTPAAIVAGLTTALVRDYADGTDRFLAGPSLYWADGIQPLIDAGWTRDGGAAAGTVEFIAPDGQAGVLIDNRRSHWHEEAVRLWAGPPGWGTRAEVTFTDRTPSHLIAATAAAMADPAPVVREPHQIHREVEDLVRLAPVPPPAPERPPAPTPLDMRRTAVTAAVARAARDQRTDLRVCAARMRTATTTPRSGAGTASPSSTAGAATARSAASPRH